MMPDSVQDLLEQVMGMAVEESIIPGLPQETRPDNKNIIKNSIMKNPYIPLG